MLIPPPMADLILNVDFAPSERSPRKGPGNPRHRRFLQRQRQRRAQKTQPGRKAKPPAPGSVPSGISTAKKPPKASKGSPPGPPPPHRMVAIDCEMVGTGPGGRRSALARCSIVGYGGEVLYDRYVRPTEPIVDYRTRWSGIRPRHMAKALPFPQARREIVGLLAGKVVVGHSIENDFRALRYQHPPGLTRDTATNPLLNLRGGFPQGQRIALRRLTRELLHRDIQVGRGGHSSVEDAQATMELYRVVETEWEQHLLQTPTPPGGAH